MKEKVSKVNSRKIILLIFNILFYCLIDFKSLPVLLFLVCISYFLSKKENKKLIIAAIVTTILIFLFYKSYIKVLPLGLSFYSFKILSYLFDVYRNKISIQKFFDYTIYVTYFPQIISGPISKSKTIIDQLEQSLKYDEIKWMKGIQLIISGMFLKFVIANRSAVYVNEVFNNYTTKPGLALLIAAFLYSIQIYGDFSGYSNISIGVSNFLGIDCDRNFNRPYFSKSIKEFWTRWHISLSTWLKDYIYIPLGGNRKGKARKFMNNMITFLVSGFWHGNGTGYIFWGIYHGILSNFKTITSNNKLKIILFQILTFIEITIGWIFFRLTDFMEGINYLKCMISNFSISYNDLVRSILPFTKDNLSISMAIVLLVLVIVQLIIEIRNKDDYSENKFSVTMIFYIIMIILFGIFSNNGFIYMNF